MALDLIADANITLAHDWLVGMRGGERVLERIAAMTGPADLLTLVHDGQRHAPAIDACRIITSPLQGVPGSRSGGRRWMLPLMPWAVGRLRVPPCNLLVSTSSALIKGVTVPRGMPHLCYCHSPARYLWEQGGEYRTGRGGVLRGLGLAAAGPLLRRWDRRTAAGVTTFLANSTHTAARIQRCFGRSATVIHPPVETDHFTPDASVPREDFLLVVSALEPYKRIDLVIAAANRHRWKVVIAGTGSQEESLRRQAGPTVTMAGFVDDDDLLQLYRRAKALLFPQCEDFGIVAAEAQACGCPLIARKAGGAIDIIVEGTGIFFEEPTVEAVAGAVARFDLEGCDAEACVSNAQRFSVARFDEQMAREIMALLGGSVSSS